MVITIDGPAGAGKSTAAKLLAKKLGFMYIDSGAMYRALTLKAVQTRTGLDDPEAMLRLARTTKITLKQNKSGQLRVLLDGRDVTQKIRTPELTGAVFKTARIPQIREIMVEWQRAYAAGHNLVMEGRDIGTVVFPRADKKFYLEADFRERARRRFEELREKGSDIAMEEVIRQVLQRDDNDRKRRHGPLKKAPDAVLIDSTRLTVPQVVDTMIKMIKK